MSSFTTAARDPIFWMHHANIDRLWERWLDEGGGRANPTDSVWLNTEFDFFDADGSQVTLTGSEIIDTVGQLSYRYDDDPDTPRPPAPAPEPEEEGERPPSVLLAAGSGFQLGGDDRQSVGLDDPVEEAEVDPEAPVLLAVEGLEFERTPTAVYEIYVNLPAGDDAEYTSPHYIGNLSFFGIDHGGEGDHADHQVVLTYDITELVRRLRAVDGWEEGDYDITFARRTLILPPDAAIEEDEPVPITIGRISVRTE